MRPAGPPQVARSRLLRAMLLIALPAACERADESAASGAVDAASVATTSPSRDSSLVVRVLDVGQGDATLITNGGSTVLVDGGPDQRRLGHLLDSLGLRGTTIDVVVISHPHLDHYRGLQSLFETRRRLRIRYVFEGRDVSPNATLATLRDSILARVRSGETVWRDTDDPCGDGTPRCTVTLRGGARLHVLRPDPRAREPNERSTPVKLVAADSAALGIWLGGDAERGASDWFDRGADYDRRPGMDVHILKAAHHGSCDGISSRQLDLVTPEGVVASLGAENDYGHVHEQTKRLLRRRGIPWYRTDLNGTITIRSPGAGGAGYTIEPQRGTSSMDGRTDRRSGQRECGGM